MVRFSHHHQQHQPARQYGGDVAHHMPLDSRFNDIASYVTDTSSITNPVELGSYYSNEDECDDDGTGIDDEEMSHFDSATSALTGLTGWTSARGHGSVRNAVAVAETVVSELGISDKKIPVVRSKSYRSACAEGREEEGVEEEYGMAGIGNGENGEDAVAGMVEGNKISAISFEMDGSVETSLGVVAVARVPSCKDEGGENDRKGGRQGTNHDDRAPSSALPSEKAIKCRSPSEGSCRNPKSQKRSLTKSNGGVYGVPTSSVSPISSVLSGLSRGLTESGAAHPLHDKRGLVPPLRDPNMDDSEEDQMWEEDCNYDINPTLMFLVLESHNWSDTTALLDGKGLENKGDVWNLGQLFGGNKRGGEDEGSHQQIAERRQRELKAQARTWIVRRERNGILRWRMLPIHAALAFHAPFEIMLRLYHLYPGAVRCRDNQGMLPLHHCFKYGSEDKVLELFLDVFPEALTVGDDRGRLPLACTPKDGSDNERRSHIIKLFSNFQVGLVRKEMSKGTNGAAATAADKPVKVNATTEAGSLPSVETENFSPPAQDIATPEGTLGAMPRYMANVNCNHVSLYNSITPPTAAFATTTTQKKVEVTGPPSTPLSPKDEDISDRYAMLNCEDSENIQLNGNHNTQGGGGLGTLSPIPEDDDAETLARRALRSELLALQEGKKKKKKLRKFWGRLVSQPPSMTSALGGPGEASWCRL